MSDISGIVFGIASNVGDHPAAVIATHPHMANLGMTKIVRLARSRVKAFIVKRHA